MANRVKDMRSTAKQRLRTGRRRMHVVPDPEPRPEPVHPEERRWREAGGPEDLHGGRGVDQAVGGYLFEAPVTASVTCPHCGVGQAW